MPEPTAKIKVSAYHVYIASGSDITSAKVGYGGYDADLGAQLAKLNPNKGGTLTLTARGCRDLSEFACALAGAESQGGNPAGGRSLAKLEQTCAAAAEKLEGGGS